MAPPTFNTLAVSCGVVMLDAGCGIMMVRLGLSDVIVGASI
jgi:hypothetical protein